MLKKIIILLIFILLTLLTGLSAEIFPVPEISRPAMLRVHGNRLFIPENHSVHIYTLDPFRHQAAFGKKGEGPGEFKYNPFVQIFGNELLVNGMNRLMFFSLDGHFVRETRLPFRFFYIYFPLIPAGDKYAGLKLELDERQKKMTFMAKLYDQELNLIRNLHKGFPPVLLPPPRPGAKPVKTDLEVIYDYQDLDVCDGKIFIADTRKGFFIAVYDLSGNPLYEIRKNPPKIKVSPAFKRNYLEKQQQRPDWETRKQWFNLVFRDVYPAFFSFKVRDKTLYVTTYSSRDGLYEVIKMDLEGNELRRAHLFPLDPFAGYSPFYSYANNYDIQTNRLYYLKDNINKETWELHAVNLF